MDSIAVGVQVSLLLVVKILNKLGNKLLEVAFLCISCVKNLLIMIMTLRRMIIKKRINMISRTCRDVGRHVI